MISSMVVPGWILLCECIMVSTATVSPESTTSLGGSLGSSQPHWVVSSVAGRTWYFPPETSTTLARFASSTCWATAYRPTASTIVRIARAATPPLLSVTIPRLLPSQGFPSVAT
jgi:hypothetical protein